MKHPALLLTLLATAMATPAVAVPLAPVPHDVCVNQGIGVPSRQTTPVWASTMTDVAGPVDPTLDDPRWNEATTRSFGVGSATATMKVRQLWSTSPGGQEYLYLSLVSDLNPNATTGRDIYLGFHRKNPGMTGVDAGITGYILQIHLNPTTSVETAVPIAYCGSFGNPLCTDGGAGSLGNWWRVFRDAGATNVGTLACDDGNGGIANNVVGEQFKQWNGSSDTVAPFTWLDGAIHAWKSGPGSSWAVQLRLKIVNSASAASPALITDGIEKGSTVWYEAIETSTLPASKPMSIMKYPLPVAIPAPLNETVAGRTGVTHSVCKSATPGNDRLIHQDLRTVDAKNYSAMTDVPRGAALPGDCDLGLSIAHIGAVFNNPGPYDTIGLTTDLKATDAANVKHANTIIAQVVNTNPVALGASGQISAPVQARFRLANWGTEGLDATGTWADVPGGSAVCLGGASCPAVTFNPGDQKAIAFNWQLGGTAASPNPSEYCAYGLTPPGGSCVLPADCPTGQTKATGEATCIPAHGKHQCMYVELTSPHGTANFVKASAYNNMNFAPMSTVVREALVDARTLPKAPGQQLQDIYFYVIPRNMPGSVPAGTTTTALIQNAAITRALAISQPYLADIARLSKDDPALLERIKDNLAKQRPGQGGGEVSIRAAAVSTHGGDDKRIPQIGMAAQIMPNEDFARVVKLVTTVNRAPSNTNQPNDELVHNLVETLGPEEAAQVVPTLEIYPFYKPADGVVYQPMTSFTLFLSHEATLGGMRYEVDGADKVADNVYHVQVPVDFARKIQIRAQALTDAEAALPPGMPKWPCAGGCASCGGGANRNCGLVSMVGNGVPGLLAGVLVVRRRRKKPAKAPPAPPAAA